MDLGWTSPEPRTCETGRTNERTKQARHSCRAANLNFENLNMIKKELDCDFYRRFLPFFPFFLFFFPPRFFPLPPLRPPPLVAAAAAAAAVASAARATRASSRPPPHNQI